VLLPTPRTWAAANATCTSLEAGAHLLTSTQVRHMSTCRTQRPWHSQLFPLSWLRIPFHFVDVRLIAYNKNPDNNTLQHTPLPHPRLPSFVDVRFTAYNKDPDNSTHRC
jgi:hypothetical protein